MEEKEQERCVYERRRNAIMKLPYKRCVSSGDAKESAGKDVPRNGWAVSSGDRQLREVCGDISRERPVDLSSMPKGVSAIIEML